MAEPEEGGAPDVETRGRMLRALREALKRAGGARRVSGLTLVTALCVSAIPPVAVMTPVVGPALAAWLGTIGGVGANLLGDVIKDVAKKRPVDAAADRQAVESALAEELEARMADPGPDAAALRDAVATVLRQSEAQQVLLEALAEGNSAAHTVLAESMALLAEQFDEFATLGEEIHGKLVDIRDSLRAQQGQLRAQSEQAREQSLMLSQVLQVLRRADAEAGEDGSGGEGVWPGCPYRGLLPFSPREAQIFYGRKDLTLRLSEVLAERLLSGGLLVVTGASGAGKSSLLSAGLVPAVSRGEFAPGSADWLCRTLTPTSAPLRELAAQLAALTGNDPETVWSSLKLDPKRAAALVAEAVNANARRPVITRDPAAVAPRLVLIVDQFEELFTLTPPDEDGLEQRAAFIDALHAAATEPTQSTGRPAALVVVSIRGDFLDQAFDHAALAQSKGGKLFIVGPMTESELRSAITGPAAEAHLRVEPDLVDEIVRPLLKRTDSAEIGRAILPLVSEVMAATWENREGGGLTLLAYGRAGGVGDAVNNGARGAYRSLKEKLQPVARALFLRLTLVAQDGRVVRRPASREELCQATRSSRDDVDTVIEVFATRRLLVVEDDHVEIPHDALLQSWSDLQGWLDADKGERIIYGRLATDAQSWHDHGKDAAYLYPGGRLEEIASVQARWKTDPERYPAPAEAVERFLEAGRIAEEGRQATEKKRASRLRYLLIGLAVFAVVTASAAAAAGIADERARREDAAVRAETTVAVSRQLALQASSLDATDPYTARQLAVAAWVLSGTDLAGQTEAQFLVEQRGTIITPDRPIYSIAYNQQGTVMASAGADGRVRLWNTVTQRQTGTTMVGAGGANVPEVAFNRAGTLLATAGDNGTVRLWNPANQQRVGAVMTATDNGSAVLGVAFNRTGTLLATAGGDGTVRLWNTTTDKQVGIFTPTPGIPVPSVAFSPDGALLAAADDIGTVRLWNTATRTQAGVAFSAGPDGPAGVAFDPASPTMLATAAANGTVRFWSTANDRQVGSTITTAGFGAVLGLSFNANGTLLATAAADGTVRLWNTATKRQFGSTITATGGKNIVWDVAFNPSGTLLATAGGDGIIRLWNPLTQQLETSSITASAQATTSSDIALNSAGTLLATAESDGTVEFWDPSTEQRVGTTIAAGSAVSAIAFNPAGTRLATVDADGTVRLWNPATGRQVGTTIVAGSAVSAIAFNPGGTLLATAESDGSVEFWDPTTEQRVGTTIAAGSALSSVAFNPAGTRLATVGGDGTIRLWNPATGKQAAPPIVVGGVVSAVAFNPAGTLLAGALGDGKVGLWDAADGRTARPAIDVTAGKSIVWDVAFDPSGTLLATASGDKTVRLWDVATGQPAGVGGTLTVGGAALKVMFDAHDGLLATAAGDGSVTLLNAADLTDPQPLLCAAFGLPSSATWSNYARTAIPEPADC